jgi:hypothetical protein
MDTSRDEYIEPINEGIGDALSVVVPEEYLERALKKKFIPKEV